MTAGGDVRSGNEEDGVGANDMVANALGKTADVVGHATEPEVTVRAFDELAVVAGGTCAGVNDGIGLCGVTGLL
jgi:hypothetical protein